MGKTSETMKRYLLELPNETIGLIFRELYTEYEKNLRNIFNDPNIELSITPRQIVDTLRRQGLEEYATQVYILFGGMYAGCVGNVGNVIHEVNAWVTAYRMADEFDVDVSEIDHKKALEYYGNKG